MSLYRIFRCGIFPNIQRTDQFIFRKKIDIKYLPLIAKKSTDQITYETDKSNNISVYAGPLGGQIRRVKVFTLITSLSGLFAQPVIYERAQELGTNTILIYGLCSFVGFFTFVTPFLIHLITKKYVTEITYNKMNDSYTATVITLLLRRREITFKPGEPIVPDVLGMFTSMTIRGIPLFIDARFFEDLGHYKKIMGYDKPIDFKLSSSDKPRMTQSN